MVLPEFSAEKTERYMISFRSFLPKFPVFSGLFVLIVVALAMLGAALPAEAQAPAATHGPSTAAPSAAAPAPTTSVTPDAPKPAPSATPPSADDDKSVAGTGSSLIPHDLSPYGMFMHADVVVKVVMVGLAFASLVTWTILLAKSLELVAARRRASRALTDIADASNLREAAGSLKDGKAPVTRLVAAALAETEQSRGLAPEGVKERATALLSRIEARAGRSMARGTGLLATIGSTAPFVGLFGTVWGIMNSFIGISKTNTTNLAVVAPGIAEALLATAFGLVAAIPAVIIYNMFARGITGYRSILGDASTEVLRLLSRDLDRGGVAMPASRAAE